MKHRSIDTAGSMCQRSMVQDLLRQMGTTDNRLIPKVGWSLITERPKLSADRASICFVLFYSTVNYFNSASHFALRAGTPSIAGDRCRFREKHGRVVCCFEN